MSEVILSNMAGAAKAKKAARLASMPESQAQSADPAISPAPTNATEIQPEKLPLKRTIAALDRNIEACDRAIERMEGKLALAKADRNHQITDRETVPSLKRSLENLQERKAILLRLRAKEARYRD